MNYLTFNDYARHKRIFAPILDKILKNGPVWMKGKDVYHLEKRKEMGHVPDNMGLNDYNRIIMRLLQKTTSKLTLHSDGVKYIVGNGKWIVIINKLGLIETCFPPDNYKRYFARKGYVYLGKLEEVLEYV